MQAKKRPKLLPLLLVGLVAGGIAWAMRPQPVAVDIATLAPAPMAVTVNEEGWTRVRELFVVSAPVAGRLVRLDVKAGDTARAGDTVLATVQPNDPAFLDPRAQAQAEATLQAAEAGLALADAALASARAELGFARAEVERSRALAARGAVSPRALERAEADLRMRDAALQTATADRRVREYQVKTARAALITPDRAAHDGAGCCLLVKSPIDGRVLRVLRESEGVVAAGAELVELGDLAAMEVVAELLSTDAVRVPPQAEVEIVGWGGRALRGRVRRVEPYGFNKVSALGIEERRVLTLIDFAEDPAGIAAAGLGHGYRVEVKIRLWAGDNVLAVPTGALFRRGGDWTVFVVENGRAVLRTVGVDHMNERHAEVTVGLKAGERIVLHPGERVKDGTAVVERQPG